MDLAGGIAELSMSLKAQQFQQDYAVAIQKKVMDTAELAAEELLEMAPEPAAAAAAVPKGDFVDVYA